MLVGLGRSRGLGPVVLVVVGDGEDYAPHSHALGVGLLRGAAKVTLFMLVPFRTGTGKVGWDEAGQSSAVRRWRSSTRTIGRSLVPLLHVIGLKVPSSASWSFGTSV